MLNRRHRKQETVALKATAEKYYESALAVFATGKYEEAEIMLATAQNLYPSEHEVKAAKASRKAVDELPVSGTRCNVDVTKIAHSKNKETGSENDVKKYLLGKSITAFGSVNRTTAINNYKDVVANLQKLQHEKKDKKESNVKSNAEINTVQKINKHEIVSNQTEKPEPLFKKIPEDVDAELDFRQIAHNAFFMRIKMFVRDLYLNTYDESTNSHIPGIFQDEHLLGHHLENIKEGINGILMSAVVAFDHSDLETAVLFLEQAEKLYSRYKVYLLQNNESNSNETVSADKNLSYNTHNTVNTDIMDEVEKCTKAAQKAISIDNFKEAELILDKAEQKCPSTIVHVMLSEVRAKLANNEAKNCINIAKVAFAAKKFEIAEALLIIAQGLNSNIDVTAYLAKVRAHKGTKYSPEQSSKDNETVRTKISIIQLAQNSTSNVKEKKEKEMEFRSLDQLKAYELENINIAKNEIFNPNLEAIKVTEDVLLQKKDNTKKLFKSEGSSSTGNASATKHSDKNGSVMNPYCLKLKNNQEDADASIEKAITFFHAGNLNKAERLLLKAERLCPSTLAKILLSEVRSAKVAKTTSNLSDEDENYPPKVETTPKHTSKITEEPRLRQCTYEHLQAILRVKQAKNDYDVLEVPKEASARDIRKALNRLRRILHPDKNPASDAQEAIIIVTEAATRLLNAVRK